MQKSWRCNKTVPREYERMYNEVCQSCLKMFSLSWNDTKSNLLETLEEISWRSDNVTSVMDKKYML